MTPRQPIPHFERVDTERIQAVFSNDGLHRASLLLPYLGRERDPILWVIGQNPSAANSLVADKTIRFLEKYVYERLPKYGAIQMLNLYSRIDTKKLEMGDLLDADAERIFRQALLDSEDVLAVFGKLQNKGPYRFRERAEQVRVLLSSKKVYKFSLGTHYAPHPGNSAILYSRFDVEIAEYDFADLRNHI